MARSAALIPSNYVITESPIITLYPRVLEGSEQSGYVTIIKTADAAAAPLTIKLDADVSSTIVGYIMKPSVRNGDSIEPDGRDSTDPAVLLFTLRLRRTTTGVLAPTFYS